MIALISYLIVTALWIAIVEVQHAEVWKSYGLDSMQMMMGVVALFPAGFVLSPKDPMHDWADVMLSIAVNACVWVGIAAVAYSICGGHSRGQVRYHSDLTSGPEAGR